MRESKADLTEPQPTKLIGYLRKKSLCLIVMHLSEDSVEQRARDKFVLKRLEPVPVEMLQGLPEIDAVLLHLKETTQGERITVPRWAAEVLSDAHFAKVLEEPFENEVFRAVAKERLQNPPQLSKLSGDFYHRLSALLSERKSTSLTEEKKRLLDRLEMVGYDLITTRLSKMLSSAVTSSASSDLYGKLSPEESELFKAVNDMVTLWRKAVLEGDSV